MRLLESKFRKPGATLLGERDSRALECARQFMSDNYWQMIIRNKGHVIVFNEAYHIAMFRLLEVAVAKGLSLAGVVLYPIESDDPVVSKSVVPFYNMMIDLFTPVGTIKPPYRVDPASAGVSVTRPAVAPSAPPAAARPVVAPSARPIVDQWSCLVCTFLNSMELSYCEMCLARRS